MADVAELTHTAPTTQSPSGSWSAIVNVGPSSSLIKMVDRDPAIMPISPKTEGTSCLYPEKQEHSRSSPVAIQALSHWPHLAAVGGGTV